MNPKVGTMQMVVWLGLLVSPLSAQESKATLKGHSDWVSSLAYSPDGKTLASASSDKTIKLWDVQTGKERATLKGHKDWVTSVAFSPDGKMLASGCIDDRTIKLWEVATGKELATLRDSEHDMYGILSIAFSPDGRVMASGAGSGFWLWDIKTATLQNRFVQNGQVYCLRFLADGKLAEGNWNGITLWDVEEAKVQVTFRGHTNWVCSFAFSPDGKTLASGSNDKTLRLWDVETGKERMIVKGQPDLVSSVAYSPNGKLLASGCFDRTIKLWEVATGKKLAMLTEHTERVMSVAFSPDGKTLASGSRDKTIKLWDVPVIVAASRNAAGSAYTLWNLPLESPPDDEKLVATEDNKRFPDGRVYDFGEVKHGVTHETNFRIVNSSDVPLSISSLGCSSCSFLSASVSKRVLQPEEEGVVEFTVDARKFVGLRTMSCLLQLEQGGITEIIRFSITANSVEDQER